MKNLGENPCPVCSKKLKFHLLASIRIACEHLQELELLTRPEGKEQKY